jgi:hypothetical protein
MRDVTSVLRSEEAVIGRWFSDSPYGLLFHGPEGRAWRISHSDADLWQVRRWLVLSACIRCWRALGALEGFYYLA